MRKLLYITLLSCLISACSNFQEKVGLVKYQPDEYQVVTNPSLEVPPDFNIYSPAELETQKTNVSKANSSKFSKAEDSILKNMNKN